MNHWRDSQRVHNLIVETTKTTILARTERKFAVNSQVYLFIPAPPTASQFQVWQHVLVWTPEPESAFRKPPSYGNKTNKANTKAHTHSTHW